MVPLRISNVQPETDAGSPASQNGWTVQIPLTIPRLQSKPRSGSTDAQVAQLVEHATENRSVGGSTPSLGTNCLLRHWSAKIFW